MKFDTALILANLWLMVGSLTDEFFYSIMGFVWILICIGMMRER
jgi:hypothetical protein